jgi:hypothetical protein
LHALLDNVHRHLQQGGYADNAHERRDGSYSPKASTKTPPQRDHCSELNYYVFV